VTPGRLGEQPLSAATLAERLGISLEAASLYDASEVIDLHVDTFIWQRVAGYDLTREHGRGLLGGMLYGQVDLPRLAKAGVTGATWVITTNPARDAWSRQEVFFENLRTLTDTFQSVHGLVEIVRTRAEYAATRARGKHCAFIGVQGGNALDYDLSAFDRLAPWQLLRITLVHLSSSSLGTTSSPAAYHRDRGLTPLGKRYVERLNQDRIFVDLAHINKQGFWDAKDVHDPALPVMVSHTAMSAVHEHWRNLDDDQQRAVANSGGIVGAMYHSEYLGDSLFAGRAESIVLHLEHAVDVAGEDHVALGSDWDGAICTPRDMPTCSELPRLVDVMLRRGWRQQTIRKVLGENFLAVLGQMRPD
jgi:membrane dipeptidase